MLKRSEIGNLKLVWLRWAIEAYAQKNSHSGCWLWLRSKNKNGYGSIRVNTRTEFVHRVSYIIFVSDIPPGLCVCHTCDNPSCVNPKHLWLGTRKQNSEDMVRKQRASRISPTNGFKPGHTLTRKKRMRKLTDEQVREIRATLYTKEPLEPVAERYGVSISAISNIRRGKRKQLIS